MVELKSKVSTVNKASRRGINKVRKYLIKVQNEINYLLGEDGNLTDGKLIQSYARETKPGDPMIPEEIVNDFNDGINMIEKGQEHLFYLEKLLSKSLEKSDW